MKLRNILGLSLHATLALGAVVIVSNHIEADRAKWAAQEFSHRVCNQPGRIPPEIRCAIYTHAKRPELVAAVAYQESRFRPHVCSKRDACGLMQFMNATAQEYSVDRFNIVSSIKGAEAYIGRLEKQFGNLGLALAAYNYGPGNLGKWLKKGSDIAALPVETQNYVMQITGKPVSFWLAHKANAVHVASLDGHVGKLGKEFKR
jgi:soluble lytic murein transglycosylase-like protein